MKNKILVCIAMSLACSNSQAFNLSNRDDLYLYATLGVGVSGLAMANFLYYKRDQWRKELLGVEKEIEKGVEKEIEKMNINWKSYENIIQMPLKKDSSDVMYQSQIIRKVIANDGTVSAIVVGDCKDIPYLNPSPSGIINEDNASKEAYSALKERYYTILHRYRRIGAVRKKGNRGYLKYIPWESSNYLYKNYDEDSNPEYYSQRWWERSKDLADKFEDLNEEYTNFINENILFSTFNNNNQILERRRTKAMRYTKIYDYAAQASSGIFLASICLAFVQTLLRNSA